MTTSRPAPGRRWEARSRRHNCIDCRTDPRNRQLRTLACGAVPSQPSNVPVELPWSRAGVGHLSACPLFHPPEPRANQAESGTTVSPSSSQSQCGSVRNHPNQPCANHNRRNCCNLHLDLAGRLVRRPDAFARVGRIDRSIKSCLQIIMLQPEILLRCRNPRIADDHHPPASR